MINRRCVGGGTRQRVTAIAIAAISVVSPIQQTVAQQLRRPVRDSASAPAPLFTKRDALMALGFAVGTVAFFPLDRRAALELQDSTTQTNKFFKNASTGVELIASPGAYFIGGGLYIVGRLGHYERVTDLGWHGTEAVLFAQGITSFLKGTLGRARPFVSSDTNPADFKFAHGFGNGSRSSFPSGHTTTAFAAAAAVTAETGRWWPKSTIVVGPLMYGGATLVGLSRMYHDRHWGSDVILGAAIGTFSGQKIVQYSHKHPHNAFDRVMLRTRVVPTADGGALMLVSVPW
jgi:membrane-associated phospholipid phosphatase